MNASDGAERASRRELVFVAILLLVGFWLRLYALDQYPLGVHQDELSNIYDGYSISETGADRFGDKYPLQVRGFGERDYRPSLYAWLAAVPIRLSGFSVTAGRLPSAIFGFASLVLLYGFARRMGGATFGVLALLLGVLSPLHIQYSRVAHEGSMLPAAFLILALLLWQRAAIARFAILPTVWVGLAIGISANPYQSSRLTAFTRLGKFQWLTREALAAARDSAIATGSDPLFVSMSPLEGLTAIDSVTFQQEKAWLMVRPRAE